MGRPLLALGLIAIATLLLGSLFAELEDSIRDPEPFTPDAETLAKAAEAAAAHPEYLETAADAGAFEMAEDTQITIPPGAAEVDGELLRLLQEVEWTLPAGTEIEELTLPLPPGTEIDLPSGTRIVGDTLVFPEDSTIVLADGTELELPHGGRLRIPGADAATLRAHIEDGTFTIPPSGGIFTAPTVHNRDAWPMTLPDGTTFRIPDGFELPEGIWQEGGTIDLPAGHRVAPEHTGDEPATPKEGLFEKIGKLDLRPPETGTDGEETGTEGPAAPVPAALVYWSLGAVAAALAAFLLWRHRHRLRGLVPGAGGASSGAAAVRHPFRLIAQTEGHPEALPLAVAPDAPRRIQVRFEAEAHDPETEQTTWEPTAAVATVRLGTGVLHDGPIPREGLALTLPALPAGDHALSLDVRIPGHRAATLADTVRVAPWSEQVARDYDRLAEAVHAHTRLPHGFTPRMLEGHARPSLPPAAHPHLSAALTLFERANYSQGAIGEREWIAMVTTVEAVRKRLLHGAPATPQRPPKRRPVQGSETA